MIRNAIILLILSTIALNAKDVIKPYKKMYDDGKTIEVEGSKKLIKTTPKSMQDGVVEIECGIQKSYHPNGKIKSEIKYTCYPMESSDSTSNIIYEKNYNKQGVIESEKSAKGEKIYENGRLKKETAVKPEVFFEKDIANITMEKVYYDNGNVESIMFKPGIHYGEQKIIFAQYTRDGNIISKYTPVEIIRPIGGYVKCGGVFRSLRCESYNNESKYEWLAFEYTNSENFMNWGDYLQNATKIRLQKITPTKYGETKKESICDIKVNKESQIESIKCIDDMVKSWINPTTYEEKKHKNGKDIVVKRIKKDGDKMIEETYANDGNLITKKIYKEVEPDSRKILYRSISFLRAFDKDNVNLENNTAIITETTFRVDNVDKDHYRELSRDKIDNIYIEERQSGEELSKTYYDCNITKANDSDDIENLELDSIKCRKTYTEFYNGDEITTEYYAKDGTVTDKYIKLDGRVVFSRVLMNTTKAGDTKSHVEEKIYDKTIDVDSEENRDEKVPKLIAFTDYICDIKVDNDNIVESMGKCVKTKEGKYLENGVFEEARYLDNKRIIAKQINENAKWYGESTIIFANDGSKTPCGVLVEPEELELGIDISEDKVVSYDDIWAFDDRGYEEYCPGNPLLKYKCDFIFKTGRGLETIKCNIINTAK